MTGPIVLSEQQAVLSAAAPAPTRGAAADESMRLMAHLAPAGTASTGSPMAPSMWICESHSSHLGKYQFAEPRPVTQGA